MLLIFASMNLITFFRPARIRMFCMCMIYWTVLQVAVGQDFHYSQFYHNPVQLSAAATGAFKGDLRAMGMYRSQWKNVPVAYETFAGAVEWKALRRHNNLFSAGLLLQHDKAGDAGLSSLQIGANLGAMHVLDENNALSIGFGVAMIQRSFDIGRLRFKNQWGGDAFNPDLPTGENFNKASALAPSLSAGLLWHYQFDDTRSQFDIAAGAAHINKPIVSLGDFDERLKPGISFFVNDVWQMNERSDLVLVGELQRRSKASEYILGAGIRRILTSGMANETNLQFLIMHRLGDAIIPAVQLERNNLTCSVAYDWNVSRFDTATNGQGGIEIAVIWQRIPVPKLRTVKSCPVF